MKPNDDGEILFGTQKVRKTRQKEEAEGGPGRKVAVGGGAWEVGAEVKR